MNIFKSLGVVIGMIIGLIICVVIFKYSNKDHKVKSEYDERQQEIRGKGYQRAFYTAMILEAVMLVLQIGNLPLPFEPYQAHAAVIFISCTVLCCYTVWKGAYWGLNNNRKRYFIILSAMLVLNAIPVIGAAAHGELLEDGKLAPAFINLLAFAMLIVIGIVMLLRNYLDKKAEEE